MSCDDITGAVSIKVGKAICSQQGINLHFQYDIYLCRKEVISTLLGIQWIMFRYNQRMFLEYKSW